MVVVNPEEREDSSIVGDVEMRVAFDTGPNDACNSVDEDEDGNRTDQHHRAEEEQTL